MVLSVTDLRKACLDPHHRHSRAVLALGAAAALLAPGAWRPAALVPVADAVEAGCLLIAAVGSRRVAAVADRLRQARFHWAALGVLGLLLAVLGVTGLSSADGLAVLENTRPEERIYQHWPYVEDGSPMPTDGGTPVRLDHVSAPRGAAELGALEREVLGALGRATRLIQTQPADDRSNCFGWVLTGGRYWLGEEDADVVLRDH